MSTESHELAICLINENSKLFPCEKRRAIIKHNSVGAGPIRWVMETTRYAHWYEREYGGRMFSTLDILLASVEVAQHYLED